jgi:hypothetical protein
MSFKKLYLNNIFDWFSKPRDASGHKSLLSRFFESNQ